MSGTTCLIIIRGNMLQAIMRTVIAQWGDEHFTDGELAIANAQSLCQLGTSEYDGVDVFTADQKLRATQMMEALNNVVLPIVEAGHLSPRDRRAIRDAVNTFNDVAEALLAEVSSG
jgi:hypothetical protein